MEGDTSVNPMTPVCKKEVVEDSIGRLRSLIRQHALKVCKADCHFSEFITIESPNFVRMVDNLCGQMKRAKMQRLLSREVAGGPDKALVKIIVEDYCKTLVGLAGSFIKRGTGNKEELEKIIEQIKTASEKLQDEYLDFVESTKSRSVSSVPLIASEKSVVSANRITYDPVKEFTTLEVPLEKIISMANEIYQRHNADLCQSDFQYYDFYLKHCQQLIQLASERRNLLKKFILNIDKDKMIEFYTKAEPFVKQLTHDLVIELTQLGLCYVERGTVDQSKIEALVDELNSACLQLQDLFYHQKAQVVASTTNNSRNDWLKTPEKDSSKKSTKPKIWTKLNIEESPKESSVLAKLMAKIKSTHVESSCTRLPEQQLVEAKLELPLIRSTEPPNVDTEVENFIKLKTPLKRIISLADSYCKMLLHKEDPCEPDFMFEDYFLKVCVSCREFSIDRISKLPIIIDSFVDDSDRLDFCQKLETFMQQFACTLIQALKRLGQCYIQRGVDRENISNELKSVTEHTSKLKKTFHDQMKTLQKANKNSNLSVQSVKVKAPQEQPDTSQNLSRAEIHQQKLNSFAKALKIAPKSYQSPSQLTTKPKLTSKKLKKSVLSKATKKKSKKINAAKEKIVQKCTDDSEYEEEEFSDYKVYTEVSHFTRLKVPIDEIIATAEDICYEHTQTDVLVPPNLHLADFFLQECHRYQVEARERCANLPRIMHSFKRQDQRESFCCQVEPFVRQFTEDLVGSLHQLGQCYLRRGVDEAEQVEQQLEQIAHLATTFQQLFAEHQTKLNGSEYSVRPSISSIQSPRVSMQPDLNVQLVEQLITAMQLLAERVAKIEAHLDLIQPDQ